MQARVYALLGFLLMFAFVGLFPIKSVKGGSIGFVSTWGGDKDEVPRGLTIDSGGNLYVTGYTTTFGTNRELFLLKYDYSGNLLKQWTWGGLGDDSGLRVAVDKSGNIYILGETNSFTSTQKAVVLKLNSTLDIQWQFIFGSSPRDELPGDMTIDGSGNVYVTGTTYEGSGSTGDIFLIKLDSMNGSEINGRFWGTSGLDVGTGVALDPTGHVYVAGYTNGIGAGSFDALVLKYDSSFNLIWQRTWGGVPSETATGVSVDSTGKMIYVSGALGNTDVFLLKFDPFGVLLWQKAWGNCNLQEANGMGMDPVGNVYITGRTTCIASGNDAVFFLKFDPSGVLNWALTWGGGSTTFSRGENTLMAFSGALFVTGYTQNAPYGFMANLGAKARVLTSGLAIAHPLYDEENLETQAAVTGAVAIPAGSTTYVAGFDAFLMRYDVGYLTMATQIVLYANPPPNPPPDTSVLQIGGHNYTNGAIANLTEGNYTAMLFPQTGYAFSNWQGTGGITLSNELSNPTNITLTEAGTLTANLTQIPSRGLTTQEIFLSSMLTLAIISLKRRVNRRSPTLSRQ